MRTTGRRGEPDRSKTGASRHLPVRRESDNPRKGKPDRSEVGGGRPLNRVQKERELKRDIGEIEATELADGSVTEAKLASGAVTSTKIGVDAITEDNISSASISTAKITDANVTTPKLADDAVTGAKIASGTITSDNIAEDNQYHSRYNTEAETQRSGATATTEIYYTARPDGDGYAESEVDDSGVPVGDTVVREIYFSDKFDADPDTSADWTAYTTQPANNETFANAKAALLAGLNDTDGTANTRGTLPLSLKMERSVVTNLLLDDYPGAEAAYSVRKLRTAYSGSAIRVREDSGNTETDIGFTTGVDLDTAAIASHCGANNGYVVTWYDQSGNGNNATQSTTTKQPQIYNGSSVITKNGKPAAQFDGSNDELDLPNAVQPANINNCSAFTVQANTTGFGLFLGIDVGAARWYQGFHTGGNEYFGYAGSATAITVGLSSTNQKLFTAIAGSTQGNAQAFIDGVSKGSTTLSSAVPSAGYVGIGIAGQFPTGTFQEVVVYHSDQSSNRTGIESDINSYYSIY
jgi:hypothetical protein